MRRKVAISFVLAVVTLAAYWPVRHHAFIAYDDLEYVANNPHIKAGLSWTGIGWAFSHLIVSNWHPVATLSHMLDCELFGLDAGAHHLVNVGFHAANAVLLFLALNRMTRAVWRSTVVAGLFALHPLHVESVAWIAERKDVLSTFFFMLTLFAYVGYVEKTTVQEPLDRNNGQGLVVPDRVLYPPRWAFYLASLMLFALGLMSKPMLVTLPFVLLLLDYWPLQRFNFKDRESNTKLLLEKLPFLVLSIGCSVVTLWAQRAGGAMKASATISLPDRIANAIVSYFEYLSKAVWPSKLAVIYPHPALGHQFSDQWPVWQVLAIVLLLAAVSVACVAWGSQRPWLAVGWFWYLGTLLPVIGLIQVGPQAMADRYTYISLIGIAISLVWAVAEMKRVRPFLHFEQDKLQRKPPNSKSCTGRAVLAVLAAAPLAAFAVTARNQLYYWRDTRTLFEHNLAVTGENLPARALFAVGLEVEGKVDEAIEQYCVVAAVDPVFHCHLAQLLSKKKAWPEAEAHYLAAVASFPNDLAARLGLAEVSQQLRRDDQAVTHLQAALRIDPKCIQALNNLAWLRATHPDVAMRNGLEAVELAERACRLTQYRQAVLIGTLAAAYAEAERFEEAIATARRAYALAAENGEQALLEKNQELLQTYLKRQPYHEP